MRRSALCVLALALVFGLAGGAALAQKAGEHTLQFSQGIEAWMFPGSTSGTPVPQTTCPLGVCIGMPPTDPAGSWAGVTSDDDPGYIVAQPIGGGDVTAIDFWGLNAWFDPYYGWTNCSEDPMTFDINYYDDNAGVPGSVIAGETVALSGTDTGWIYSIFSVYHYSHTLITPWVGMPQGYVAVQGVGSPGCWFLWAGSPSGAKNSFQQSGGVWGITTYYQAMCLQGSCVPWEEPPPPPFDYEELPCLSAFEDIAATGTSTVPGDDDGLWVPLGFTFNWLGTDYTEIAVCSNGYMTFGTDLSDFSNDPIPSTWDPNSLIAPLWDDWEPNAQGDILYETKGPAGDQRFIAQWDNVPTWFGTDSNTFQAVIFERTGAIEFRYGTFTPFAGSTVGLENTDGSAGLAINYDALAPGDCVQMQPTRESPCVPTDGYSLLMPGTVEIGEWFPICVEAPANYVVFLMVSAGQGPLATQWGDICLDFPFIAIFPFVMPDVPELCFEHFVYCDPGLLGMIGYFQFLALDLGTGTGGVSNQMWLNVTDGPCDDV